MSEPLIGIVMGSDSDLHVMNEAITVIKEFSIPYEVTVASAHRTPERVAEYAKAARDRGIRVIIAGAGGAAHLAGVVASMTTLPVIGVPIDSSPLKGIDALLSTAQMPGGIPVATMAIGRAGAKNAAIFAIEILAITDRELYSKLISYRKAMADDVEERDRRIKEDVSSKG